MESRSKQFSNVEREQQQRRWRQRCARNRLRSIKTIECVEIFCYNKLKAILKTSGLNLFLFFCWLDSFSLCVSYKSHRNNQSFVIVLVKLAMPTPLTLALPSLFFFFFELYVSFVISWLSMLPFTHLRSLT